MARWDYGLCDVPPFWSLCSMIDSHCHLNASYDSETVESVLKRFTDLQGKIVIDVTTTMSELGVSQQIIAKFPSIVFCNIGIHPEGPDGESVKLEGLITDVEMLGKRLPDLQNVVGIGETGLDYSHFEEHGDSMTKVLEHQRHLFLEHIKLAKLHSLPLTIHARGEHYADFRPYQEVLDILEKEHFSYPVYFHSFGGDYALAKKMIERGYYLGVNGIVTYSGAKVLAEVVEKIPLERFLLETDAPFLIPSNMDRSLLGNSKVNEPIGIFSTAKRVAALRKCPVEEVLDTATISAKTFFARLS